MRDLCKQDIWVGNSDDDNDEISEGFTLQVVKGEEMDTDLNNSQKMKILGGKEEKLQLSTNSLLVSLFARYAPLSSTTPSANCTVLQTVIATQ